MRTLQGHSLRLLLLVAAYGADWSLAQSYPTKPIQIQAAAPGTSGDVAARLIAPEISASLGQSVVVENRAPAVMFGGVRQAAPDGYTLMVAGNSLWLSTLLSKVPYSIQEYAPISMLTRSPYILVVHPSVPVKTVADLIKLAKARPGALNYSSGVAGSASHVAGELFKSMAGVDITRIVYKAQATEGAALLSGEVQVTFASGAAWDGQIKAGKLRALASAGLQRSLLFPDLPTVAATLPGYSAEGLIAFFAPVKTPDAIVRRLNQETSRALQKAEVRDRLVKSGVEPVGGTPEQLADAINLNMTGVAKMIADGLLKPGEL